MGLFKVSINSKKDKELTRLFTALSDAISDVAHYLQINSSQMFPWLLNLRYWNSFSNLRFSQHRILNICYNIGRYTFHDFIIKVNVDQLNFESLNDIFNMIIIQKWSHCLNILYLYIYSSRGKLLVRQWVHR